MRELTAEALGRVTEILRELKDRHDTNQLASFKPYGWQMDFMGAKDLDGDLARQVLLMAANKVGKTWIGARVVAIHATGRYPDWWPDDFPRWNRPIKVWAGGNNNFDVRDLVQGELFGEPGDEDAWGKAAVPLECIGKTTRKPGIPEAFESVKVKHVSGRWSKIIFKGYESGKKGWMGTAVDIDWLDEEPPPEIFSQGLRATLKGGMIMMTFTPESGLTPTVAGFMNNIKPGQAMVRATWDDAPHLTEKIKTQTLAALLPHEREMRSKGVPELGSGMVFPVLAEDITIDSFPIPKHWPRIAAMDFGWDHPTAVVWIAWDRDGDVVYIYDCYRGSREIPAVHGEAIKARGPWIPMAWPHDGHRADPGSGEALATQYRRAGVKMLGKQFANPEGGNSVEPGIMSMLTRMQTGRFKVFSHLKDWFEEFNLYYRKEGMIVKERDDLMSASRYGEGSLRFARTDSTNLQRFKTALGVGANYDPLAERL